MDEAVSREKSWTHSICISCWQTRNPGRAPFSTAKKELEVCCFCGEHTSSGIYVRGDPNLVEFCQHSEVDYG
jgi:hypothetical protein